ncbi:hypothetical protein Tco_1021935, partial [Tanacetum coccineum]
MVSILLFYKDNNLPSKDQDPAFLIWQKGEKESKALKLIKASNNGKRKAYGRKRAIAYMKLFKTQGEDN